MGRRRHRLRREHPAHDRHLPDIAGLVAIFDDEFYVVTRNYTFDLDVAALGLDPPAARDLLVAASAWACSRAGVGGVAAIVIAMLSAVANFFFIPYYPFWAILMIALDVWVIWALTRPGAIRT